MRTACSTFERSPSLNFHCTFLLPIGVLICYIHRFTTRKRKIGESSDDEEEDVSDEEEEEHIPTKVEEKKSRVDHFR